MLTSRQAQLRAEQDAYQRQIQFENIRSLQLQNNALSASNSFMEQVARQSLPTPSSSASAVNSPMLRNLSRSGFPLPGRVEARAATSVQSQNNSPSSAEIQSMIESSQQRAQEDFRNQINLLQAQWQQNQEERQVASPPTPSLSTPSNLSPINDGSSEPPPSTPADNFPSLAEIRSMIESSQQRAQEDFTSRINLLQTQEQQRQEEEQLSARNAATRMQNYQRQSAIGAWESALRGR